MPRAPSCTPRRDTCATLARFSCAVSQIFISALAAQEDGARRAAAKPSTAVSKTGDGDEPDEAEGIFMYEYNRWLTLEANWEKAEEKLLQRMAAFLDKVLEAAKTAVKDIEAGAKQLEKSM